MVEVWRLAKTRVLKRATVEVLERVMVEVWRMAKTQVLKRATTEAWMQPWTYVLARALNLVSRQVQTLVCLQQTELLNPAR